MTILVLFPYALIFSMTLSNALIGALTLVTILEYFAEEQLQFEFRKVLVISTPFLVTLVALAYTSDFQQGIRDVETRASLVVLPLLFALRPCSQNEATQIIKHFLRGLALTLLVALTIAVYHNIHDPNPAIWFNKYYYQYDDFLNPLDIDPLYISLYLAFGIAFLELELVGSSDWLRSTGTVTKIVALVLLILFLLLTGSRSWIIFVFILSCVIVSWHWSRYKAGSRAIVVAFMVTVIAVGAILPITRDRFLGTFTSKYDFSAYQIDRLIIWSTAMSHVAEHPSSFILGGGTGSSNNLMNSLYEQDGIQWEFEQKANTHNQYLNFLLNQGMLGVIILVLYLVYIGVQTRRKGLVSGVYFAILLSLGFLVENYLDRQKGVVFIALFVGLFLFLKESQTMPHES